MKLSRLSVRLGVLSVIVCLVAAGVVSAVPSLRWRAQLVTLQVGGKISDIELRELLSFMMPNSGQAKMALLIQNLNPYAVIRNPLRSPQDVRSGANLFSVWCARCHLPDGGGGPLGPALFAREFKHGESDWAIYRTVKLGVRGTTMPPHPLQPRELWQLTSFIRSLGEPETGETAAAYTSSHSVATDPAYKDSMSVTDAGKDWVTYAGSYSSHRHSALTQINPTNVELLSMRWQRQFDGDQGKIECSPLIYRGVMYVTVPPKVMALNAATGAILWVRDLNIPSTLQREEDGRVANRGVALLGDKVFVGTEDARLIAIVAKTGEVAWETVVADRSRYFITPAPLALRDTVITGVGMFGGGRGFIAAYDANTGKERWRFDTVPAQGEKGNETWRGKSWRDGGGPTWITGSYDPQLDLLYWGIGNPKPDYDPKVRKGDNLYTNSVVALQASTGKLVWHFQFTPADDHDWDSNQSPVLIDYVRGEAVDRRLAWANRNGFYYVLDRSTGQFIHATAFVYQNWSDGFEAMGRPIRRHRPESARLGYITYPGTTGGTNWWPPSYDPALSLFFVPVLEQGEVSFPDTKRPPVETGSNFYTAVRALDALSGAMKWEFRRPPRNVGNMIGGVLSTRSGLLFGSDQSTFFVLDSRTGQLLHSVETGGTIEAPPVTYMVAHDQYVAIASRHALLSFALPKTVHD